MLNLKGRLIGASTAPSTALFPALQRSILHLSWSRGLARVTLNPLQSSPRLTLLFPPPALGPAAAVTHAEKHNFRSQPQDDSHRNTGAWTSSLVPPYAFFTSSTPQPPTASLPSPLLPTPQIGPPVVKTQRKDE